MEREIGVRQCLGAVSDAIELHLGHGLTDRLGVSGVELEG
jgi:hypothetical protein